MTKPMEAQIRKGSCLEDDDLYAYLTGSPGAQATSGVESHLAACPHCRRELAELVRMLHPEPQCVVEMAHEPAPQEIEDTIARIQESVRRERNIKSLRTQWHRWGAIAAAAVIAVGLCSAGFMLYERARARAFCEQARASLQGTYAPQSPSDLRLDLPFRSENSQRGASNDDGLASAENLFNRALGVQDGMREARLGLGYVHLRKGQFAKAQEEFEGILAARDNDVQALLGRGVSRFEEGISGTDPMVRDTKLRGALADFESALKRNPDSDEARFNRIRALYEMGRHKEALQEITAYLARDSESIWAVKLQNLKIRILTSRAETINKEVYRAAKARDAPALDALVRVAPYRILPVLRALAFDIIALEGQPEPKDKPVSSDLQWALAILASTYSASTGDTSCAQLLAFHAALTPSQRRTKRDLDARLERLLVSWKSDNTRSLLPETRFLIRGFEGLKDYWQLVRVYQLRGSAATLGKTDFREAADDYLLMLNSAELSADPDLTGRALSSLGYSYIQENRYDEALSCYSRLKKLAANYRLENWSTLASSAMGNIYARLNQLDEALREYSDALAPAYRQMDANSLISSLMNLAGIMARMGRYAEGSGLYAESAKWLNTFVEDGWLAPSPEVEFLRLNLLSKRGYLALQMKEPAAAEVFFRGALSPARNGMRELDARSRVGLAQAYLDEKRYREASAEVDTVLDQLSRNDYPEIAWQANSLKGYLLKQAGDSAGALKHFRRAQSIVERMRTGITTTDLRQSFFVRRFDPFREAVSLQFDLDKDPGPALGLADRAKGMTLREYLSTDTPEANARRSSASWVRGGTAYRTLPARMLIVEYFLCSDRILTFVSGSRGTEAVSTNMPSAERAATIRKYLESIRNNDGASFDTLSKSLYQTLIRPVESKLDHQNVDSLVIIPDGPLHLIPFGSLRDPGGQYLLEKFILSYAPSRGVLQYCMAMNRTAAFSPESRMLLMDGSSNLAGASRELARLAKIFPKNSRLVGASDLPSLGSAVGGYDIIHFSGHANLYRGRPRLVFSGPRGEEYLDYPAIENWKLRNGCLISLLGCNTGVGPVFDGESAWGLVPALLNAGAPALLVSLLPVSDEGSGELAVKFYDFLAQGGKSRAGALRESQLSLLKTLGAKAQARPNSWAPFVLIGDPR